jgi:predicted MFS family arabinose efflux permease
MKQGKQNPIVILALLFMIGFLGELDYQLIPPLLPLLAKDFTIDPGYGARAVTVYSLSSAFFSLLFGYLSDRHGRKPFILLGLLSFSIAAFLTSQARSVESFFLLRFLSGMATGAIVPSVTSLAADSFHYEQRGRAMGVLSVPYFMAAIIGIPAAAIVASALGWRPIFQAISVSALGCGITTYLALRHIPSGIPTRIESPRRFEFGHLQSVWKRILKRQDTLSILLASMFSSSAIVGFITYLGSHLATQHHLSVKQVGFVYLYCGLASVVGAPLSGFISD